ncbi:MAG: zinc-dependent metalloprotease, partial [bacterium]
SAHEIGHTLGLIHNFAASANGRASVMDYPHPKLIRRTDGTVDLSEAYDTDIGEWDKLAIQFGYREFPEGTDEISALDDLLRNGYQNLGLNFISDDDARPQGGMHPLAHLWDNGKDAVAELENLLAIRSDALRRFSASNIRAGRPLAALEDVLVPLYFLHRYQSEAVAKLVGGVEYGYQTRGGWQKPPSVVPGDVQRKALDALMRTISPQTLRIPDEILAILPPRPPGFPQYRELFMGYMGPALDPLAAAEAAAGITVSLLLNPQRAARLAYFGATNNEHPGLEEVIDRLIQETWKNQNFSGIEAAINQTVSFVVLENLLALATSKSSSMPVKAITLNALKDLKEFCVKDHAGSSTQHAVRELAVDLIEDSLKYPRQEYRVRQLAAPPGSPIGSCGIY